MMKNVPVSHDQKTSDDFIRQKEREKEKKGKTSEDEIKC